MRNFLKKNCLEIVLFLLIFFILSFFASKTWLFYDDVIYGFPAVTNKYITYYKFYIRDWGLFRPLALVYYFYIYEIFTLAPWLAHLTPLSILIFSGFLIYKILVQQGLSQTQALAIGLIYTAIPFSVESVSWLSANTSLVVILIYFIQIYLIETNSQQKNLLRNLMILQLISTFLYESILFLPLSLSYLIILKNKESNKIRLAMFSIFPLVLYFVSKMIIKPLTLHKDKLIGLSDALANWTSSIKHLKIMLSSRYLQNFWAKELLNGLDLVSENIFLTVLFSLLISLLLIKLLAKKNFQSNNNHLPRANFYFWGLSFILSLIPLSWQPTYLPFRTLLLPFITITSAVFFLYNSIKSKMPFKLIFESGLKFVFIMAIVIFLLIQTSMYKQYVAQYTIDQKITMDIDKNLKQLGFHHPNRSHVLLRNFSYNNVDRLRYGDYIYGLYHYYWSAEALLDLYSGSFARVSVEFPSDNFFTARKMTKGNFLKLRPLTLMRFTDNKSCLEGRCIIVEKMIK